MAWTVRDSFNSYPDGDLNTQNGGAGWNNAWSGDTAFQVQGIVVEEGDKALSIADTGGNSQIGRGILVPIGNGIVHFAFQKDSTGDIHSFQLRSGTAIRCQIVVASDTQPGGWPGDIALADSDGSNFVTVVSGYSADTWYEFDIEFDVTANTARARVDDGTWTSTIPMTNAGLIDTITLRCDDSSGSANAYWDDIRSSEAGSSVDILSFPAGATVIAAQGTDAIYAGTAKLVPKFVPISDAASGDTTLVSAVSGKKIRVLSLSAFVSSTTEIYFTSNSAGTVIFGDSTNTISLPDHGNLLLPFTPLGWMETNSGEALVVNLNAANTFSGGLVYVEI